MDDNRKQDLFACCITDGILDNMSEERQNEIILAITKIKEKMLNVSVYIKERE